MLLDVERCDFLKRFVGFSKHRYIEPRIQRLLSFFPAAIRGELFRRDFNRHFIAAINFSQAGRIYPQIVEHDALEQIGNELLIFGAGFGAQRVDQIS